VFGAYAAHHLCVAPHRVLSRRRIWRVLRKNALSVLYRRRAAWRARRISAFIRLALGSFKKRAVRAAARSRAHALATIFWHNDIALKRRKHHIATRWLSAAMYLAHIAHSA